MKGTIAVALRDMVTSQFGKDVWENSLEAVGLPRSKMFLQIGDVDDAEVLEIVEEICRRLNITLQQAADAFGDYWMNVYAPKVYSGIVNKHKNARSFLLDMNNVHIQMTKTIKNAAPPSFEYEWINDNTLIMKYISPRGLIDFAVGLAKGVGKYFGENLTVTIVGNDKVQIVFN